MQEWKDIDAMQELPHADIAPTYARMQKTSLGPLLLTPPFAEGSNPGPFATFRTTQPLGHTWPYQSSCLLVFKSMSSLFKSMSSLHQISRLSSSFVSDSFLSSWLSSCSNSQLFDWHWGHTQAMKLHLQWCCECLWYRQSWACCAHGNNFYWYGGQVQKYGTLRSLRYIYSNLFRFPIFSLGLPNFTSQKSWEGALPKYATNDQSSTRYN